MATPTVPDAPTLITNGSTAEQVVRYLLRYREASTQDIAEGTGISRSASWGALSRLRSAGVVLVVRERAQQGHVGQSGCDLGTGRGICRLRDAGARDCRSIADSRARSCAESTGCATAVGDRVDGGKGMSHPLLSPFPYFGGKRTVAADVWRRLGSPSQYIEPFCGSAAVLLAAPQPAALEVVCDGSGFIANFWRAVKHQPAVVAEWADYPVSHIDLGARHVWLMAQRDRLGAEMQDPDWPGDAKVAGWWLWGQCCWIGSGWCDWFGQIPHVSDAGRGVQAIGQIPHVSNAGRGVQAIGQIPHVSDAGMGVDGMMTSCGRTAWAWLHRLADRLERVRVVHGDWTRCLNNHFGGDDTAVFLDPPYRAYERLYGTASPVADAVEEWAQSNGHLRIALCGHCEDYALPGWDAVEWSRGRLTYSGGSTTDSECVWYSPACLPATRIQEQLFA